jgi:transposase
MFIRKTKKIDPKNGRPYFLLQLVESFRTEKGPRQRVLMNLGVDLGLDAKELKELANRIEDIISGQQSLILIPEKIETLAQSFASQLIGNLSKPRTSDKDEEITPDHQTIDVNTVEHTEARTIGCEHLLYHIAKQLQLDDVFKDLGMTSPQISLALGTILARAIFPASERASFNWLQNQSALGELLNFNFQKYSLSNFYKISDTLLKHKEELESHIHKRQNGLHRISSTLVLYDLTNTYMQGQAKANPKAKHGRSKEKRTDCPLITLGLVLDEHGFYIRSKFLPGNVSEPTTLKQAIEDLNESDQIIKPVIVMDAGISSDENLCWLRDNKFFYIVSARQNAPSEEMAGAMTDAGESGVKVALLRTNEGEDVWLRCESPAKEATANQMKTFFQQRFEEALRKISNSLKMPRGRKALSKVHERVGRMKERHSRISGCYEVIIHASPDGKTATDITWRVSPEKIEDRLSGQYFLRTNLKDCDASHLWNLYQSIQSVEDAFRFMKSSLGMRPVFHQKEKRVDGHLWITILAYCLIQNFLYQLREGGLREEWRTIRSGMQSRIRVSMQAKTKEGKTLHIRTTTKPEGFHKKIYEALVIPAAILRSKKTIV